MQSLFTQHLATVQQTVQQALELARLDGLWIYAGSAKPHFLDDQHSPFKINPHFNYVFPDPNAEQSWLYLDGKNKPKIYFYAPQDYWHVAPNPPTDTFFASEFDWQILADSQQIAQFIQPQHCAFIGEDEKWAEALGFSHINPKKVLNVLHFARSFKTEFEIKCLYQAQFSALKGHHAAKNAFLDGKSEFEINLAYLQATQQSDNNVPYGNIVAINQNSAILHYTKLDVAPPAERHSFLLDAGTTYLGYASDLTRSYAFDSKSEFAALVAEMEKLKLAVIDNLQVGYNYLSYHTQMHQWISQLLQDFDFVKLPADQIFEEGISRTFFPHGLGHQLGLQVHDVAGFQQNARGTHKAAPELYPSLRCTRDLAEGMVLTIEPGFYFIEMLLNPWKNAPLARFFNWQKIDEFKKFGGIRTEDNVVIRANGAENLTAKAAEMLNIR
ncbi:Xaa-Pro dipeptidase [Frederiksenia canicola]|uniref:Xaa-Pro dipeptidase n=1 Tax=Frederiksenia canicola TaxID=123824 RepID=A0AAE7C213_9PAST|nr:Xaa-Pro dipeptidase [Frederiksenia canicola]QIM64679.1 Xaa-Pro dipeptidase [Frederiksenia canicola]RPE91170.1 Xaa-Pro dipeptidase [Frederiksenia canicola]